MLNTRVPVSYKYLESIKIRCRGEFLSEKQILKFIVSEIKKILSNLRLYNNKTFKGLKFITEILQLLKMFKNFNVKILFVNRNNGMKKLSHCSQIHAVNKPLMLEQRLSLPQ